MVAKRLAQLPVGANQHRGSANLPTLSQAEAVKTLYVSERAVRHAAVVQEKAVPELVAAGLRALRGRQGTSIGS